MKIVALFSLFLLASPALAQPKPRKGRVEISFMSGVNLTHATVRNKFWYANSRDSRWQFGGEPKGGAMYIRTVGNVWISPQINFFQRKYAVDRVDPFTPGNPVVADVNYQIKGATLDLLVEYRFLQNSLSRWKWNVGFGMGTEWIAGPRDKVVQTATGTIHQPELPGIFYYHGKKTRYSLNTGVSYRLTDRFRLSAEPVYSLYARDLGRISTPDKINLHSVSLRLRVNCRVF